MYLAVLYTNCAVLVKRIALLIHEIDKFLIDVTKIELCIMIII